MYAKIFDQIYNSSIADDWQVRLVFMDLCILADADGVVDITREAISARTRVPLDIVNNSVNKLEQPDLNSRCPDLDGARIVRLDDHRNWGWRIVNYQKYRAIKCQQDRKAYLRNYMRDRRAKEKAASVNSVNKSVHNVNTSPSVCTSSSLTGNKGVGEGEIEFLKKEMAAAYNRRNSIIWPNDEERLMAEIVIRPGWRDEWNEIKAFKARAEKFSTSVSACLENWQHNVDRARNEKDAKTKFWTE